jgi:phosphoglycolate phosphatase
LLVRAALDRGASRLGSALHPADALVVGDTPRDVSAARAHGVPVVAVATGRYGVDELRQAGADGVLSSLDGAAPALLAWVEGGALPGAAA